MDRGRKYCNRQNCAGWAQEQRERDRPQQHSSNLSRHEQQPRQHPPNTPAGNSAQILFREPNFVETPSEYETFYDCSSDCELAGRGPVMSKVLTNLEDPGQFRGTLKRVVCTSHKLLKTFDEASRKKPKHNQGPGNEGPANNRSCEPYSFTIPVTVQLQCPMPPNAAGAVATPMEPIRTSIVAATGTPNLQAEPGRLDSETDPNLQHAQIDNNRYNENIITLNEGTQVRCVVTYPGLFMYPESTPLDQQSEENLLLCRNNRAYNYPSNYRGRMEQNGPKSDHPNPVFPSKESIKCQCGQAIAKNQTQPHPQRPPESSALPCPCKRQQKRMEPTSSDTMTSYLSSMAKKYKCVQHTAAAATTDEESLIVADNQPPSDIQETKTSVCPCKKSPPQPEVQTPNMAPCGRPIDDTASSTPYNQYSSKGPTKCPCTLAVADNQSPNDIEEPNTTKCPCKKSPPTQPEVQTPIMAPCGRPIDDTDSSIPDNQYSSQGPTKCPCTRAVADNQSANDIEEPNATKCPCKKSTPQPEEQISSMISCARPLEDTESLTSFNQQSSLSAPQSEPNKCQCAQAIAKDQFKPQRSASSKEPQTAPEIVITPPEEDQFGEVPEIVITPPEEDQCGQGTGTCRLEDIVKEISRSNSDLQLPPPPVPPRLDLRKQRSDIGHLTSKCPCQRTPTTSSYSEQISQRDLSPSCPFHPRGRAKTPRSQSPSQTDQSTSALVTESLTPVHQNSSQEPIKCQCGQAIAKDQSQSQRSESSNQPQRPPEVVITPPEDDDCGQETGTCRLEDIVKEICRSNSDLQLPPPPVAPRLDLRKQRDDSGHSPSKCPCQRTPTTSSYSEVISQRDLSPSCPFHPRGRGKTPRSQSPPQTGLPNSGLGCPCNRGKFSAPRSVSPPQQNLSKSASGTCFRGKHQSAPPPVRHPLDEKCPLHGGLSRTHRSEPSSQQDISHSARSSAGGRRLVEPVDRGQRSQSSPEPPTFLTRYRNQSTGNSETDFPPRNLANIPLIQITDITDITDISSPSPLPLTLPSRLPLPSSSPSPLPLPSSSPSPLPFPLPSSSRLRFPLTWPSSLPLPSRLPFPSSSPLPFPLTLPLRMPSPLTLPSRMPSPSPLPLPSSPRLPLPWHSPSPLALHLPLHSDLPENTSLALTPATIPTGSSISTSTDEEYFSLSATEKISSDEEYFSLSYSDNEDEPGSKALVLSSSAFKTPETYRSNSAWLEELPEVRRERGRSRKKKLARERRSRSDSPSRNLLILQLLHEIVHLINEDTSVPDSSATPSRQKIRNIGAYNDNVAEVGVFSSHTNLSGFKITFLQNGAETSQVHPTQRPLVATFSESETYNAVFPSNAQAGQPPKFVNVGTGAQSFINWKTGSEAINYADDRSQPEFEVPYACECDSESSIEIPETVTTCDIEECECEQEASTSKPTSQLRFQDNNLSNKLKHLTVTPVEVRTEVEPSYGFDESYVEEAEGEGEASESEKEKSEPRGEEEQQERRHCDCCHCRAMRETETCNTIATPEQALEDGGPCKDMKYFIDSMIMDLDAMDHARRNKMIQTLHPKKNSMCGRKSFPVSIMDVSELGSSSLYIKWCIHDCYGVGGYEIYVDGHLTNRYYHSHHEAAVICDVNITEPHKIVLLAQPKRDEPIDDYCSFDKDSKSKKNKSLALKSANEPPTAIWAPSVYFYDPVCSRSAPSNPMCVYVD